MKAIAVLFVTILLCSFGVKAESYIDPNVLLVVTKNNDRNTDRDSTLTLCIGTTTIFKVVCPELGAWSISACQSDRVDTFMRLKDGLEGEDVITNEFGCSSNSTPCGELAAKIPDTNTHRLTVNHEYYLYLFVSRAFYAGCGQVPTTNSVPVHLVFSNVVITPQRPVNPDVQCGPSSDTQDRPKTFSLENPFPNPFNPSTTIQFTMENTTVASLKVFNVKGAEVATLASGLVSAGEHMAEFHAENLSSGLYFVTLEAEGAFETRKLMLLK